MHCYQWLGIKPLYLQCFTDIWMKYLMPDKYIDNYKRSYISWIFVRVRYYSTRLAALKPTRQQFIQYIMSRAIVNSFQGCFIFIYLNCRKSTIDTVYIISFTKIMCIILIYNDRKLLHEDIYYVQLHLYYNDTDFKNFTVET